MNKLIINKDKVISHDISHLKKYLWWSSDSGDYDRGAGEEAYKLYASLSHEFNDTIILDIGTRHGNSALALSDNTNNKVISYDIVKYDTHQNLRKKNLELRILDFTEDEDIDFSKVNLILIDIDPHDGVDEKRMFKYLKSINWSGIVLLDDTREDLWPDIDRFVKSIKYKTYDVTDIGHFSGTTVVEFGDNWTVEIQDSVNN
jgi:hypothetical protein